MKFFLTEITAQGFPKIPIWASNQGIWFQSFWSVMLHPVYGVLYQSWLAVIPTYIHTYYLMVRASSNFFFFFFNGYLGYPEITLIWEIFIFNWFLARSPHFLPSLKVFKNLLRFMCYCVIYNRSCYLVKFCYWVPKLDFWVVLDP